MIPRVSISDALAARARYGTVTDAVEGAARQLSELQEAGVHPGLAVTVVQARLMNQELVPALALAVTRAAVVRLVTERKALKE